MHELLTADELNILCSVVYHYINAILLFFFLLANSSTEVKVLSTEHGIVLYSMVTYYTEEQRVGWLHKYVKSTLFTFIHKCEHNYFKVS